MKKERANTRAYRYKMQPTCKERECFAQFFGCSRFVYNWGLGLKIERYKSTKEYLPYEELALMLTVLKQTEEHKWLQDAPNVCLQQSLRCLETAYKHFFKDKMGFPKFKSKHCHKDAIKFVENVHFDFDSWKVKIPKVGWVKICHNREIPSNAKIKTLTVKRDACGTYWCTVVAHFDKALPPKAKVEETKSLGIDMGIKSFATLSNGKKISNPKYFEREQCKLAHLQRRLSRRKKGSHRWERARIDVAKCHRHIRDKRKDFLDKLTTELIRSEYTTFCLEDLNIKGMEKNHHLANSIASASWYAFKTMLTYKADWCGKNVKVIDRFEPSSKTCNHCGYVNKDLQLKDRKWVCPQCGQVLDRDINAAKNIRDVAIKTELENSPSESGAMGNPIERTWRHAVTRSMKRQDNKSINALLGKHVCCFLVKTKIQVPMIKYKETMVTFSEVPNEISLCINLTNCPFACPECHSPWLQEDIGDELTPEILLDLIKKNDGITCVCFMGGDSDVDTLYTLIKTVKENTILKTAWYSGGDKFPDIKMYRVLDFLKIGPYIKEKGPLTSRTTNQQFYKIVFTDPHTGEIITESQQSLSEEAREEAEVNAILMTELFWR